MSEQDIERYEQWDVVKKVKDTIQRYGKARVYFCATSCGLDSRTSSRNKMFKWIQRNWQYRAKLINVPDKRGKGYTEEGILAIRIDITRTTDFIKTWVDLNTLRARCGCSIFISDGQEVNVRVMSPHEVLALEYRDKW